MSRVILLLLLVHLAMPQARAQSPATDSAASATRALPDDTVRIKALREVAFEYLQSAPDSALQIADEIKAASARLRYAAGEGMANDIRGNVLRTRGEYNQALNMHLAAMRIFDSLGDARRYRSVLVNAGTDYFFLKNYDRSLACYRKALSLTLPSETSRYVTILNNLGNVYTTMDRHRDAIRVYEQALPAAQADSTYRMQASIYASTAIAYAESGDLAQGISYMRSALRFQKACNDLYHYASSASTLGGFLIEEKQYRLADHYLEEALKVGRQLGYRSVVANYYRNKAHLLSKTGKPAAAYDMLQRYTNLNDSLLNESHVAELAEAEVKFNMQKQSRELAESTAVRAFQQSEIRQQTLWKYIFLLLLLAILGLLALAYRNMRLKRKVNLHLEEQNAMLQKESILAQYETLRNQVNPHFLFNSLNALSSLIRTDPLSALEFTAVFSRLYRTVLELKGDSVIPLNEELKLADDYVYLQKIRFGSNLTLSRTIPAQALELLIPPFCVQMLIENAIKHNIISTEHPLLIRMYTEDGFLVIENTLQPRAKTESTGVGIRNITARFRIIHDVAPSFYVQDRLYVAKVPLIRLDA